MEDFNWTIEIGDNTFSMMLNKKDNGDPIIHSILMDGDMDVGVHVLVNTVGKTWDMNCLEAEAWVDNTVCARLDYQRKTYNNA